MSGSINLKLKTNFSRFVKAPICQNWYARKLNYVQKKK